MKISIRILAFVIMCIAGWWLWTWYPLPSSAFASAKDVEIASRAIGNDLEWFDKNKPFTFADKSKKQASILHWLLVRHHISDAMISKLVEVGSDPTKVGQLDWGTAARYAIISGKVNWIKAMIDGGMQSDSSEFGGDEFNRTILFVAVTHRQLEIIKLLLLNGADINHRSRWGDYPINAANPGAEDIMIYLIDHGAKLSQKDEYGYLFCAYYPNIPDPIVFPKAYAKYKIIRQKAKLQGIDLDCEAERKIRRPDLFEPEIPE